MDFFAVDDECDTNPCQIDPVPSMVSETCSND